MKMLHSRIVLVGLVTLAVGPMVSPVARGQSAWFDELVRRRESLQPDDNAPKTAAPIPDFGTGKFTITLWVKTASDGPLLAKTAQGGGGGLNKLLFLRGGQVHYDISNLGCVRGRATIADGRWHHVALCGGAPQLIYVDGLLDAHGILEQMPDPKGIARVLLFGGAAGWLKGVLNGQLDDVRLYHRVLSAREISEQAKSSEPQSSQGTLGYWPFDGDSSDASGGLNHASPAEQIAYGSGKFGEALSLSGKGHMVVDCDKGRDLNAGLWAELATQFTDSISAQEMSWEREDNIWSHDWKSVTVAEAARRYAAAVQLPASIADRIKAVAAHARSHRDLTAVRELYLKSRRYGQLSATLSEYKLPELRRRINLLYQGNAIGGRFLAALDQLAAQATQWQEEPPSSAAAFDRWQEAISALRRDALVNHNPLIDFDKLVFIKRYTFSSNHYYTEYLNSAWTPGGGLCVLDLKTGTVDQIATELKDGVFMRFDVSFDAKKIIFDWKCAHQEGYRIYEINVDGTGLRQLTFPQEDEEKLVELYRARPHYHHGTDDMHPCYLPNGDICFISTRCQYGILCDGPDDFSTTVLYRMDRNGKNIRRLTNSSVSEAAPVMLPDGRIMYTRWEYFDKGAVSVKCLWSMYPDGTNSMEVYGNDIVLPPTFIYARPIPDMPNGYVTLGTPHYPHNGVGTVIRLDMNKNIRTRDPMTYMTPYVDIRGEGGFHFKTGEDTWESDRSGRRAPLFRDPYPLSPQFFLVSHKPIGPQWNDPKAYGLYLLDENGGVSLIHKEDDISCWQPFPLKPRKRPPIVDSPVDQKMAAQNLARCVVTDIYHGMQVTPRGTIKYIRVLEQIPRPWATRRRWDGDCYDQQHATVTKDTHLGLKVQHGVVPVEEDGSAHFIVPALANISLQTLDENYMAVQTERTYVNYMPGESRSCIGCHETPGDGATAQATNTIKALLRPPSVPGPQPGETSGKRPIDFVVDVQPVLDKHCITCHGGDEPKAGLDLRGTPTTMFSVSYENLIKERRGGKGRRSFDLLPTIGENHPKAGNVHYLPARSLGSHNSVLIAMLSKGKVKLVDDRMAQLAADLSEKHKDLELTREELLKISNWVDTNGQFYGMYWGRKNLQYKGHPNFRPVPTFERATSYVSQIPEEQR